MTPTTVGVGVCNDGSAPEGWVPILAGYLTYSKEVSSFKSQAPDSWNLLSEIWNFLGNWSMRFGPPSRSLLCTRLWMCKDGWQEQIQESIPRKSGQFPSFRPRKKFPIGISPFCRPPGVCTYRAKHSLTPCIPDSQVGSLPDHMGGCLAHVPAGQPARQSICRR